MSFGCDDGGVFYDVIVVGGGLSGLCACERLVKRAREMERKVDVLLLEQNDRLGGRNWSSSFVPTGASGGASGNKKLSVTFDIGGQWVGPHQKHILKLVRRLGIDLHEQYYKGTKIMDYDGKIGTYQADIPSMSIPNLIDVQILMWRVQALVDSVPSDDPMKTPNANYLDSITCESYINSMAFTDGAKTLFKTLIQAVFGCEPCDLSALYVLWYAKQSETFKNLIETNQSHTFIGGAQQISLKLAEIIGKDKILTSHRVTHIEYLNENLITVTTDVGKKFNCKKIIIAMPPNHCDKIIFSPSLPVDRRQLQNRAFMGSIAKILCFYDQHHWRLKGYSGEVICDCVEKDAIIFNAFDDSLPIVDENGKPTGELQPAIVGFVNGETNRKWSQRSEEEWKIAAVKQFSRWFGPEMEKPKMILIQNWTNQEGAFGGPVGVLPPGVLTSSGQAIRRNNGRIFYAGTEAAVVGQGFMDGAVAAGEAVADQVLASFKLQSAATKSKL